MEINSYLLADLHISALLVHPHVTLVLYVRSYIYSLYSVQCYVGILAGIRPCGVIVLLAELFSSESKSQVYAHLHRKNPAFSNNLGKDNKSVYFTNLHKIYLL